MLALHANPRDQKYFIRDGTKAFGIKLTLEDGTIIERVKDRGAAPGTPIPALPAAPGTPIPGAPVSAPISGIGGREKFP